MLKDLYHFASRCWFLLRWWKSVRIVERLVSLVLASSILASMDILEKSSLFIFIRSSYAQVILFVGLQSAVCSSG